MYRQLMVTFDMLNKSGRERQWLDPPLKAPGHGKGSLSLR